MERRKTWTYSEALTIAIKIVILLLLICLVAIAISVFIGVQTINSSVNDLLPYVKNITVSVHAIVLYFNITLSQTQITSRGLSTAVLPQNDMELRIMMDKFWDFADNVMDLVPQFVKCNLEELLNALSMMLKEMDPMDIAETMKFLGGSARSGEMSSLISMLVSRKPGSLQYALMKASSSSVMQKLENFTLWVEQENNTKLYENLSQWMREVSAPENIQPFMEMTAVVAPTVASILSDVHTSKLVNRTASTLSVRNNLLVNGDKIVELMFGSSYG